MDTATLLILLVAGFLAGFVDSIAGGGGLIGISALLVTGATPIAAIGTNKVQAVFGAVVSAPTSTRAGLVDRSAVRRPVVVCLVAGALGALAATRLSTGVLEAVVPVALVAVAVFFALKPNVSDLERPVRRPAVTVAAGLVPLIGFYDGVLGPGTGSFLHDRVRRPGRNGGSPSHRQDQGPQLASILGAFTGFSLSGVMAWSAGLVMGVAQVGGAALGSRLAIANGARLIKPLLVVTCLAVAARQL